MPLLEPTKSIKPKHTTEPMPAVAIVGLMILGLIRTAMAAAKNNTPGPRNIDWVSNECVVRDNSRTPAASRNTERIDNQIECSLTITPPQAH
jgi:hypothetical protein